MRPLSRSLSAERRAQAQAHQAKVLHQAALASLASSLQAPRPPRCPRQSLQDIGLEVPAQDLRGARGCVAAVCRLAHVQCESGCA